MPDFWPSCGYRFLQSGENGALHLTDDFLRHLLARPELAPIAESCDREIALHDALLNAPQRPVSAEEISQIADPDGQENYRVFLRFRQRLVDAPTLQAAYTRLFQGEGVNVPPVFVFHLTQVLLRHILGPRADPLEVRMAECLFRAQRIAVHADGSVMAADDETVDAFATHAGFGHLGELLKQNQTPARELDLDVLGTDNQALYWTRDERFDLAVSLNRGQPALEALCRVFERWIGHFLGVETTIKHRREIEDEKWVWHVGLDAQGSSILNDLYNGAKVDEARMSRLLCLFELRFNDASVARPQVAGRPVYLAMAMDEHNLLKLKPQNVLLNLPLARS